MEHEWLCIITQNVAINHDFQVFLKVSWGKKSSMHTAFYFCSVSEERIFMPTSNLYHHAFLSLPSYSSGAAAASIHQRPPLISHSHPDQRYLTKTLYFVFKKIKEEPHQRGSEAHKMRRRRCDSRKRSMWSVTLDKSKVTEKWTEWVLKRAVIVRQDKTEHVAV